MILSTIADSGASKESLIQAIRSLGQVTESAEFWADIANNEKYGQDHRRHAVFQLFKRHISPSMKLSELTQVLGNLRWLAEENISIVNNIGGQIPVEFTFEDTVFVLGIFPELPDARYEHWAIYLRVSGKVARNDLVNLLRGESVSEDVRNAKVLEIGFSPDDPTDVAW